MARLTAVVSPYRTSGVSGRVLAVLALQQSARAAGNAGASIG